MNEFAGIIADTHGLIRPEALATLSGATMIIHAGDIGSPVVLEVLKNIAPVVAIKGNIDKYSWAADIPETEAIECLGGYAYILHNLNDLDLDPVGQFGVIIFGHSHKPTKIKKAGVLYFNPGSAGPRRFKLPVAVGKLYITDGVYHGEVIELEV